MIHLRTLGPVEVSVDGTPAPRELMWRKNLALLLYLVRSADRRRSREHLVGVFWGDKPDSSARHSLNEALRVIRKAGGEDLLVSESDQVVLSEEIARVDVDLFEDRLASGDWQAAADLVRGTFLEGFTVPDSRLFEDWLATERLHWAERAGSALHGLAEARLARGDVRGGADAAARALGLDPFSDTAVRLIMLSYALQGERAGALAVYDGYAARLADELGIEPDPNTEALAERVRSEREWQLPAGVTEAERWARRIPLVGREVELETTWGTVRSAFDENTAALLVVRGDSGSGKTRLGEEIAARARLEGATVAHIRAVPSDRDVAFSGLSALSRGGLLTARGAVRASPGALAFALAGTTAPDERLARLAQDTEPAAPGEALTDLVRAAAALGPVFLWVDGAGHLDPESAGSLRALLRDVADVPCALLLTASSSPPRDELDDLSSRVGLDLPGAILTLGSLDPAGLRELVDHVLPDLDDEAAKRLGRRIAADSASLPLLAVELLQAVRLGLELEEVEGAWPRPFQTMEQSYPGDLPDSVVAAIRVGFRRLGRPAQTVLGAASVLDERCEAALLSRATGIEGDELNRALDELEWTRWLVAEARGYVFVARIVREVVARDMLTAGQRRRILDAVAAAP